MDERDVDQEAQEPQATEIDSDDLVPEQADLVNVLGGTVHTAATEATE